MVGKILFYYKFNVLCFINVIMSRDFKFDKEILVVLEKCFEIEFLDVGEN